ncbi:MAG TPA: hypothetical protein VGG28_08655, partial [Kofleriaceae bacterium]
GGGGSATARDYFNANVYPILSATCGAAGCHNATTPGVNAPGYVSATTPAQDSSAAWTLITGMASVVGSYGATAPLISIPTTTSHYANFTTDQVTTINDWFALELAWRSAGGGSGTTATDYLAKFSGCMQITDFNTAGVATAFAQQVETNEGYCKQCHVNGQAQSYFIATPDSQNMFEALSTYREYLSTYFTIDTTTNAIIVNEVPFKLAADGGTNGEHPNNWNPTTNKGMTALADFLTLTEAHADGSAAPACGASTLTD